MVIHLCWQRGDLRSLGTHMTGVCDVLRRNCAMVFVEPLCDLMVCMSGEIVTGNSTVAGRGIFMVGRGPEQVKWLNR